MGEDYFQLLVSHHNSKYPPSASNLNEFGVTFPTFVRHIVASREEAENLGYLPDVALLEWHAHRSYHAKDDPQFDIAQFRELSRSLKGRIVFELSHSAWLINSDYPLYTIWKEHSGDNETNIIDVSQPGQAVLVVRSDFKPTINLIAESTEWRLLKGIEKELSLDELCDIPGWTTRKVPSMCSFRNSFGMGGLLGHMILRILMCKMRSNFCIRQRLVQLQSRE